MRHPATNYRQTERRDAGQREIDRERADGRDRTPATCNASSAFIPVIAAVPATSEVAVLVVPAACRAADSAAFAADDAAAAATAAAHAVIVSYDDYAVARPILQRQLLLLLLCIFL